MPPPHVSRRLNSDILYKLVAHKDICAMAEWMHAVDMQKKRAIKKDASQTEKELQDKNGDLS
jgi:hypothetical protein